MRVTVIVLNSFIVECCDEHKNMIISIYYINDFIKNFYLFFFFLIAPTWKLHSYSKSDYYFIKKKIKNVHVPDIMHMENKYGKFNLFFYELNHCVLFSFLIEIFSRQNINDWFFFMFLIISLKISTTNPNNNNNNNYNNTI